MKKFILEESEVKRILMMHKSLQEQSQPTPPKPEMPTGAEPPKVETPPTPVVSAQKEPAVPAASTTPAPTEDPLLTKLRESIKAGCLVNGKLYFNKTKNMYYYRGVKQSTKQEIDFYPDMTYKFVDGSKNGNWKCENIALNAAKTAEESKKTQASDLQKKAFIDSAVNLGYKENLTPEEIATGEYKKYIVPGSQEYFPPNGIEMYWSQSGVASSTGDVLTKLETLSKLQTINKSTCRQAIIDYYEAYKTKKDIPDSIFDATKRVVQSCVNTYEGKWGGLFGLGKVKDYVDILRGGMGGPSLRGDNSKWRLN